MTEAERIKARLRELQERRPMASDVQQRAIDIEATSLCDRLKRLEAARFQPRSVI
jgi:hypothetical protein